MENQSGTAHGVALLEAEHGTDFTDFDSQSADETTYIPQLLEDDHHDGRVVVDAENESTKLPVEPGRLRQLGSFVLNRVGGAGSFFGRMVKLRSLQQESADIVETETIPAPSVNETTTPIFTDRKFGTVDPDAPTVRIQSAPWLNAKVTLRPTGPEFDSVTNMEPSETTTEYDANAAVVAASEQGSPLDDITDEDLVINWAILRRYFEHEASHVDGQRSVEDAFVASERLSAIQAELMSRGRRSPVAKALGLSDEQLMTDLLERVEREESFMTAKDTLESMHSVAESVLDDLHTDSVEELDALPLTATASELVAADSEALEDGGFVPDSLRSEQELLDVWARCKLSVEGYYLSIGAFTPEGAPADTPNFDRQRIAMIRQELTNRMRATEYGRSMGDEGINRYLAAQLRVRFRAIGIGQKVMASL